MGLNFRKSLLIKRDVVKKCDKCQKIFSEENNFCPTCGSKLISEKTEVYANIGKDGITSYTYKLPNGTRINSKGNVTFKLAKGISYTQKVSSKSSKKKS